MNIILIICIHFHKMDDKKKPKSQKLIMILTLEIGKTKYKAK